MTTDLGPAAAPRPVPSPEDRMTETPPRLVPTFYTWLDRTEHAQLDARAACAEAERDEALDARNVLRVQLDAMTQAALDHRKTASDALAEKYAALGEAKRARAELGAAGEVLAVVRDAAERIERALAVYDTTPGEKPEREDDDAQAAIEELTEAVRGALADGTQGERVEAIRDLLEGWYANWPETAVTDPNEPLAWELAGLIAAAEARASAPSSVPPRRAQEPGAWMNRRAVVSDALGRALTARGYDVPLPVRDRCAEAVLAAQEAARAQEPPSAADLLRQAAAGRREYAKAIPEKAEPLDLQAHTLEAAARVVEGDLSPLYDWLPSWQWTDEMNARLHPAAAALNERTPRP